MPTFGSVKLLCALSAGLSATAWALSTSILVLARANPLGLGFGAALALVIASALACASKRRIAASMRARRSSRRWSSAGSSSPRRLPRAASSDASCCCACVTRVAMSSRRPLHFLLHINHNSSPCDATHCPEFSSHRSTTFPNFTNPDAAARRTTCTNTLLEGPRDGACGIADGAEVRAG